MSHFDTAIKKVLKHEGGYIDHKNDPGGATKYGISLRFIRQSNTELDLDGDGDIDADDIKEMTEDKAKEIYKDKFWNPYNYDIITDPDVATKIFDITVNAGPRQSHKLVQRACNTRHKDLDVDGLLGTQSLRAINQIGKDLLPEICKVQADFYKSLVEKKPELKVFLKGWLRRAEA